MRIHVGDIMYIIRLDDASERMNIENWKRIELLLDRYCVRPLVGVIPQCHDKEMLQYDVDNDFWEKVSQWEKKGWTIALHGYEHVYCTNCGGINPINNQSEFAGVSLEKQQEKIRSGIQIFRSHLIEPQVFFAPSHTFDENTLEALKRESNIRIISDTIANKPYQWDGITFVPQQSGRVRKLPFKLVSFCYHPNVMNDKDFQRLESFLKKNQNRFVEFPMQEVSRSFSIFDEMLRRIYFIRKSSNTNFIHLKCFEKN